MKDVFSSRLGTAAVVAGLALSTVVVGAPAALAAGGGNGPAEHGKGNGKAVGHEQRAPENAPPAPAQAPAAPAAAPAPAASPAPAKSKAKPKPKSKQRPAPTPRRAERAAPAPRKDPAPRGRAEGHRKTTICHATGSATNPYVEISVPAPAVRAHDRHQDDEDIIPAPAGGCPTQAAAPPVESRTAAGQAAPAADTPAAAPTPAVVTKTAESRAAAPSAPALATLPRAGAQAVLGATGTTSPAATGDDQAVLAATGAEAPLTAAREADDGDLPFTGLALWLLLLGGGCALLAGTGLRLAARSRA